MAFWDIADFPAVTGHRLRTTVLQPARPFRATLQSVEEHHLVIAEETDDLALFFEPQDCVDHSPAVGAAVDVVAEEDELVLFRRLDGGEKCIERGFAAVNVADGNGSRSHGFLSSPHTQCVGMAAPEVCRLL